MLEAEFGIGLVEPGRRRRRSAEERRRIVEETLTAGTSVARVAQQYGVNANQVFQWRRLYWDGRLKASPPDGMQLLTVRVAEEGEAGKPTEVADRPEGLGCIHIELRGQVRVRVEGSVDAVTMRAVLQELRA